MAGIGVQDPGIRVHDPGIGVHDGSESVFRMVRNTHKHNFRIDDRVCALLFRSLMGAATIQGEETGIRLVWEEVPAIASVSVKFSV